MNDLIADLVRWELDLTPGQDIGVHMQPVEKQGRLSAPGAAR